MRWSKWILFGLIFCCQVLFVGVRVDRGSQSGVLPTRSPHGLVGVYLTAQGLTKPDVVEGVVDAISAGKLNALVINVKNMHGELTYASSVRLAQEIGSPSGQLDLERIVSVLHDKGVYLIARQVLFYDPKLAEYLGKEQGNWVPANDRIAVEYNLQIAQEVATVGFDEIQFDYIRFADEGKLERVYDNRYLAVNAFLQRAQTLLGHQLAISIDVFGRTLWDWNRKKIDSIGQSLEEMSVYVDFVSPMIYPSHYQAVRYQQQPYLVVSEALSVASSRVSVPFRPFLQAFDKKIPVGMSLDTYIEKQIDAAVDYGADGYLFWNPSCDYDAVYRVLE